MCLLKRFPSVFSSLGWVGASVKRHLRHRTKRKSINQWFFFFRLESRNNSESDVKTVAHFKSPFKLIFFHVACISRKCFNRFADVKRRYHRIKLKCSWHEAIKNHQDLIRRRNLFESHFGTGDFDYSIAMLWRIEGRIKASSMMFHHRRATLKCESKIDARCFLIVFDELQCWTLKAFHRSIQSIFWLPINAQFSGNKLFTRLRICMRDVSFSWQKLLIIFPRN